MSASLQIPVSEKSRPATTGRPSWMGNNRDMRQREGCSKMGRRSIKLTGEKFSPPTNFSPLFLSHEAAKAEFAAVIRDCSVGDLASIADCSKETVKCWNAERAFPGGENIMKLSAEGGNPTVRGWTAYKLGFVDPDMMEALLACGNQVSYQQNPDGDAIRAAIRHTAQRRTAYYAKLMGRR